MRIPFSQSTKDAAVRLYLTTDFTREQVADECNVTTRTLTTWVADFRDRNPREYAELRSRLDSRVEERLESLAGHTSAV